MNESKLLEVLKTKLFLFGIDAPAVAWVAAWVVVAWFSWALLRLWAMEWVASRRIRRVTRELDGLSKTIVRKPGEGATLEELEKTRQAFVGVPGLKAAWNRHEVKLVPQRDNAGTSYFCEGSSDESIGFQDVIGTFNMGLYRALPGVLTGIGLCATFVALLVALLDLRLQGTRVVGLPLLIEGLSGKFLSSIVALLTATVLILIERDTFHRLDRRRLVLAYTIDRILPRLTVAQVMARMRADIAECPRSSESALF